MPIYYLTYSHGLYSQDSIIGLGYQSGRIRVMCWTRVNDIIIAYYPLEESPMA
jgi:hypothetical protein